MIIGIPESTSLFYVQEEDVPLEHPNEDEPHTAHHVTMETVVPDVEQG